MTRQARTARMRVAIGMASVTALVLIACNAIVGLDKDYALAPGSEAGLLDSQTPAEGATDAPITPVDGGADADAADAADAFDALACPSRMVRIDDPGYCIDSIEVTEAQYGAFIQSGQGASFLPATGVCNWKTDFTPAPNPYPANTFDAGFCRWDPNTFGALPVVCVDWCDAYAFCAWSGKRLCGQIGTAGGPVQFVDSGADDDPSIDEWYRACSHRGEKNFPYATTYQVDECNTQEQNAMKVVEAGSGLGCQGGYDGIFDMVGNAFEHENSCSNDQPDASSDRCKVRGGSWSKPTVSFSTCSGVGNLDFRNARFDDFGIRCCY